MRCTRMQFYDACLRSCANKHAATTIGLKGERNPACHWRDLVKRTTAQKTAKYRSSCSVKYYLLCSPTIDSHEHTHNDVFFAQTLKKIYRTAVGYRCPCVAKLLFFAVPTRPAASSMPWSNMDWIHGTTLPPLSILVGLPKCSICWPDLSYYGTWLRSGCTNRPITRSGSCGCDIKQQQLPAGASKFSLHTSVPHHEPWMLQRNSTSCCQAGGDRFQSSIFKPLAWLHT